MNVAKKIFTYYVFSNIHVGLAGLCLTEMTLMNFGISNHKTSLFVGFSIVLSYNLIRFIDEGKERQTWFRHWFGKNRKSLMLLSVLSFIGLGSIIYFLELDFNRLIILIPFALMAFFYVIPITRKGKVTYSFRSFPGLKIFSICIAWAGVTVLFPVFVERLPLNTEVFIEFFQRICILIAITIPFDIRDLQWDEKHMETLPQLLGVKGVKAIGYALIVVFVSIEIMQKISLDKITLAAILIGLITAVFLSYSTPKRNRFYTSFWVEAIPVIWFGLFKLFLMF